MDEYSYAKEFYEYIFCLHKDGNITESDLFFDNPDEMLAFIKVCLRNGIEFSVNKHHEDVVADAEE